MPSASHVYEWPRILVCVPDQATLESICDRLTADRFAVLPAPTAAMALRFCRLDKPDLMLLDLALPDGSGIDILRRIRQGDEATMKVGPRLPVILLGGRVGDVERVRGLEEGADDFLSKPASYEEIRARITAVLRRTQAPDDGRLQVGDLVVDPARHQARVGDREVRLTKKEFTLLRVLASDPARVFSKAELTQALANGSDARQGARTVETHASRLRRNLDPETEEFVVNCWAVGYSLVSHDHPAVAG